MGLIEKSEFLSEEISVWIKKHRADNFEYFKLCEDINEFSHSTMLTMTIHNNDLTELIVASLYVRAMSNFQGSIIMAERGMINEAKSLLRCFLEIVFAIVAIEKDKTIARQFVLEDLFQRRDYLKAHKRNKDAGVPQCGDAPSPEELKELLQKIENEIKENNVKKSTKRDMAEKAGLVTTYDSAYKILSGSIHVNSRDLEQYLEINDSGEVKKILWGPDVKEIDLLLFTAAENMMFVLTSVSHIFGLSYEGPWPSIIEMYKTLGKKLNEE